MFEVDDFVLIVYFNNSTTVKIAYAYRPRNNETRDYAKEVTMAVNDSFDET